MTHDQSGRQSGSSKERRQLSLALPPEPSRYRRSDYLVTESNRAAVATLDSWIAPNSAGGELLLAICGPAGAGKSHLATIVAAETGGRFITVAVDGGIDEEAGSGVLVIDRIDQLTRPRVLFDVIERARLTAGRVCIAGRGQPGDWAGPLSDLRTRLLAAARIALGRPDEALLKALILKQFADRQIRVDARVADYAAPRIDRSFDAARAFVAAADLLATEQGSPISLSVAKKVVENLSEATLGA